MAGRTVDFAVYEDDPSIFYAASVSGGLLKTINGGNTWENVFDSGVGEPIKLVRSPCVPSTSRLKDKRFIGVSSPDHFLGGGSLNRPPTAAVGKERSDADAPGALPD